MKVKIKRLSNEAVVPTKAHESDAGFDLYASRVEINKFGQVVCHTDVAFEIPDGYVGLVFPRSSISKKSLALTNCVGVIDSGYRGEITAVFRQFGYMTEYQKGERFAQIIFMEYPDVELEETDELSASDRGAHGYGSSGK